MQRESALISLAQCARGPPNFAPWVLWEASGVIEGPSLTPMLGLLNFTAFVTTAGYSAVFILCVLQSCCIPTSSEITLGFAGALAAQGKLSLPGVILVGVLGEVVGAYIAWAIGRYAGRAVVDRYGRYILLSHRDLDKAEGWYARHERFGVLGSRLIPVIRNFVAVPAGIAEVPLVRFGVLTAAGSLIWDGAWAGIGYGVGSHWHAIASGFSDIGYVLGVLAVAVIAFGLYHRYRSYREATGHDQARDSKGGDFPTNAHRATHPLIDPVSPEHDELTRTPFASRRGSVARSSTDPVASMDAPPESTLERPARAGSHRAGHARHRRRRFARGAGGHTENGQVPIFGRYFPSPLAAKVPEVIFLFWATKVLSTAGGEATSDFLKTYGNIKGGAVEVGLFVIALVLQFATRRYRAFAYWFLAFAIAIFGTGVSDFLHLDVGIPYAGTTALWAVILAGILWIWYRSEGTLSIHSITTQRRESFYWATIFATFALGTALGDFTATSLNLGYLASGILFSVIIFLPALAWWKLGLNSIAAFWMSYIVTRPLGASFADYISKARDLSGINFGDGPTALIFAIAVFVLVSYLAIARPDIQRPHRETNGSEMSSRQPRPFSNLAEFDAD
jgi:uncharacterized membrane-anchored protein/membrane protein DedA with SNARE-associated domain